MKAILPALVATQLAVSAPWARADDAFAGLEKSCAACHAIRRDAVPAPGLSHLRARKGPDLYRAGKKFRRAWLVAWLQNPVPLRPSGVYYPRVVRTGTDGADTVPPGTLPPHPRLAAADAAKAADALMSLTDDGGAVAAGTFKPAGANARFGQMAFTKLRGCAGCHQYEPGKGGLSGPELFTAGDRLQPDYVASYIADPQKLDPGVWMPRLELNDTDIQRLTAYLMSLHGGKK